MTRQEGIVDAPMSETYFAPTELIESLRRTHDAVQLCFANPRQPESLVEQRDLFWGIIGSAIADPVGAYDSDHIQAFAEIVDYLWYRGIDSPRGSDALLVFGMGDLGGRMASDDSEGYLLLNEDVVHDGHLDGIRKVLGRYGFDTLMSIREQHYGSQQGIWQESLHDQISLTPSARWIREVCAGTESDTRLTRAEYLMREAAMQGSVMYEVRQAIGHVDKGMYYSPVSSRNLRRIAFDLDEMAGSRRVNAQGIRARTNQLESLRRSAIGLLVRGHSDVESVSQDGDRIVLYGPTGTITSYDLIQVMDKLHTELGKTNSSVLNGNAIEHLAVLTDTLFTDAPLNGQPYDAIVGGAIDTTRQIIERGLRLESFTAMVDALNQLKTPTRYVYDKDSGDEPPAGILLDMPLYTLPGPDSTEKLALHGHGLFEAMEAYLGQLERPPLLETVTQSHNGLLKEVRDLLLLDIAMPEEQVYAALKASRMRQDSLLVSALGTLYSAKLELSEGAEELAPKTIQSMRVIQARLDMLSSLPPLKGSPDVSSRLAVVVQSALKPLRPLY